MISLLLMLACEAQDPDGFEVSTSEGLDALLLLDRRQDWSPRLQKDSAAKAAAEAWAGNGMGLAYLFAGGSIEDLLKELDNPDPFLARMKRELDEPAYAPVLDVLARRHSELRTYLRFVNPGAPDLSRPVARTREILGQVDARRLSEAVKDTIGLDLGGRIRVIVTRYPGGLGYQLRGNALGISADVVEQLPFLLPHELCHKFNPSERLLQLQARLASEDRWFGEAYDRIHRVHREGAEEEYVFAAGLVVSVRCGLLSRTAALRKAKLAYMDDVRNTGVPLAAIVFSRMVEAKPKDFGRFLEELHGSLVPGTMKEEYEKVLAPILGLAGMQLEIRDRAAVVIKVIDSYPAAAAGIRAGDRLVRVGTTEVCGWTLEQILDLLAGPRGAAKTLALERDGRTLVVRVELR